MAGPVVREDDTSIFALDGVHEEPHTYPDMITIKTTLSLSLSLSLSSSLSLSHFHDEFLLRLVYLKFAFLSSRIHAENSANSDVAS